MPEFCVHSMILREIVSYNVNMLRGNRYFPFVCLCSPPNKKKICDQLWSMCFARDCERFSDFITSGVSL